MRKRLVESGRGRLRQEAAFGSLGVTGAVSSFLQAVRTPG